MSKLVSFGTAYVMLLAGQLSTRFPNDSTASEATEILTALVKERDELLKLSNLLSKSIPSHIVSR